MKTSVSKKVSAEEGGFKAILDVTPKGTTITLIDMTPKVTTGPVARCAFPAKANHIVLTPELLRELPAFATKLQELI